MGQVGGGFNGDGYFKVCVQVFDRSFGLGGLRADHVLGGGVYIHFCGNGGWRFRPYGEALFSNAKKVPKKARPGVRPLA